MAAGSALTRLARDARGATAIEYALLGALIGVVVIAGANGLGASIYAGFTGIADRVGEVGGG